MGGKILEARYIKIFLMLCFILNVTAADTNTDPNIASYLEWGKEVQ